MDIYVYTSGYNNGMRHRSSPKKLNAKLKENKKERKNLNFINSN